MSEYQVNEAMRLAGLLATARCQRMKANSRNGGKTEIDIADIKAEKAKTNLREYLQSCTQIEIPI